MKLWRVAIVLATVTVVGCSTSPTSPSSVGPGSPSGTGAGSAQASEFLTLMGSSGSSTILLLGTDAMSEHDDGTFQVPVFRILRGDRSAPVLVVNDFGQVVDSTMYDSGGVPLAFTTTTDFAARTGAIDGYAGLFFASDDRCCFDAGDAVAARAQDIAAFVSSGGNLAIEDYQGSTTWDPVLHFPGAPGVLAGLGHDLNLDHPCINPAYSTDAAVRLGFLLSYTEADGCFGHQVYDPGFWSGHGFAALQTTDRP
jgi:hypothetical protein